MSEVGSRDEENDLMLHKICTRSVDLCVSSSHTGPGTLAWSVDTTSGEIPHHLISDHRPRTARSSIDCSRPDHNVGIDRAEWGLGGEMARAKNIHQVCVYQWQRGNSLKLTCFRESNWLFADTESGLLHEKLDSNTRVQRAEELGVCAAPRKAVSHRGSTLPPQAGGIGPRGRLQHCSSGCSRLQSSPSPPTFFQRQPTINLPSSRTASTTAADAVSKLRRIIA